MTIKEEMSLFHIFYSVGSNSKTLQEAPFLGDTLEE